MSILNLTGRSLLFTFVVAAASPAIAQNLTPLNKSEAELIATLRSDAPEAEKALACKFLSVVGTDQVVPELAKLLADERLNSWALIGLEAIPGSAVDEALRKAAESLEGRQLVGVINSIGVRHDSVAAPLLARQLTNKDADVASAAAVALGHIGGAPAAQPLRQSLSGAPVGVKSAIAEGLILCAERFLAESNTAEATKIYDEVR